MRYFTNLEVANSYIDITNDGSQVVPSTVAGNQVQTGNICANVYTFDPAEELISCCSCLVTPNALVSLSSGNDLISNTLTPATPSSIVVKLLATHPIVNSTTGANSCNPAAPLNLISTSNPRGFAPSLHAWGTTTHALALGSGTSYSITETEFSQALLSQAPTNLPTGSSALDYEFNRLTQFCGFIQSNGSGFGVCRSCRTGALGAARD